MELSTLLLLGTASYLFYLYENDKNSSGTAADSEPSSPVLNTIAAAVPVAASAYASNNASKLSQVNPTLASKVYQIISLANQAGYELYVDEGLRSQELQDWYYASGRTRPGNIITNVRHSKHTQGKAVDLMPVINGQPTNDLNAFNWQLIGQWARQVGGLIWGGNWTSLRDYRHVELP